MTLPEKRGRPDSACEAVLEPAAGRLATARHGIPEMPAGNDARAINEVRASIPMLAKAAVPSKQGGGLSPQDGPT